MSKNRASLEENNPLDKMFKRTSPRGTKSASKGEPPASKMVDKPVSTHKQTTLIFQSDQLEWLDYITFDSKKGGGKVVSKSELIRELVNILRDYDFNLRGLQTDDDVRARLKETLQLE